MKRRTVLIVDDQNINRKILGKLLENDYEVMFAVDVREAMTCLNKHSDIISAVLLDIVMPIMNGYEVLKEMQKDAKLNKIPVIVSSLKEGDDDEVKALELGAQDYIAKPYKPNIIKHRLANIIKLRETAAIINRSERDNLTGLYNKQFFIEKVQELLMQDNEKQYDLICVGIEHFKLVNDTYGSYRGDKVLTYVGSIINEFCKQTQLCSRFESDMFYGVIPHKDTYTNEMFAPWDEMLRAYPIEMDIKLHCGIYQITDDTIAVASMCDRAQLAAERNRGKYDEHFYLYDDSIRQRLLEEQFIISHMQSAIEHKEFVVYYQPKYDLTSEKIAGAEALV